MPTSHYGHALAQGGCQQSQFDLFVAHIMIQCRHVSTRLICAGPSACVGGRGWVESCMSTCAWTCLRVRRQSCWMLAVDSGSTCMCRYTPWNIYRILRLGLRAAAGMLPSCTSLLIGPTSLQTTMYPARQSSLRRTRKWLWSYVPSTVPCYPTPSVGASPEPAPHPSLMTRRSVGARWDDVMCDQE